MEWTKLGERKTKVQNRIRHRKWAPKWTKNDQKATQNGEL